MSDRAVFLDRDRTLMEDPGYLSDSSAVRLLPGVELALKSLAQAGLKIVVVTNQSGVARGMLTEETLEEIHAELRRQLADSGAHLDAIYYCPFHPEGTVEKYAVDSDLRKPKPGMLIKAANDLDLDLQSSWMVGDSPRDIEAGQRAGCRTIRIRSKSTKHPGQEQDEDLQADYTVRNLVNAARIILRSPAEKPSPPAAPEHESATAMPAALEASPQIDTLSDAQVHREILRHVRQLARSQHAEDFSVTRLIAGIVQVLALLALVVTIWKMLLEALPQAQIWGLIAVVLQVMALSFFMMHRYE